MNVTNFCIINNLFHHKYNDKILAGVPAKPVSLRNQFSCETGIFAAGGAYMPTQEKKTTNIWCFDAPHGIFAAGGAYVPTQGKKTTQYWMQKFFKVLM